MEYFGKAYGQALCLREEFLSYGLLSLCIFIFVFCISVTEGYPLNCKEQSSIILYVWYKYILVPIMVNPMEIG